MAQKEVALRKRQQIAKANRMMFLWVAGASVVVGIALVLSLFLFRTFMFNAKVIGEMNNTVSVLRDNNEVVPELESNIRTLNVDPNLNASKANAEDQAVQAVLDALPADGNSLAFGSSLTNNLFAGIDGVTIESVSVDPVVGVEVSQDQASSSGAEDVGENQLTFRVVIRGSAGALREALERMERSIRPISIGTMSLESQGSELSLTIDGYTYYQPARTVDLTEKTIKP